MLAVIFSTIVAMAVAPVLPQALAQDDVSVAMKNKKKTTLVAVKNTGDEPIYGFMIKFKDSIIKFAKAKGWDREKVDASAIIVKTNDKPIEPGRSLLTILVVDKKDAPYAWSALDAAGKEIASGGTMHITETQPITQQPQPEPKREDKSSNVSISSARQMES
jgi:hypothetical protein